MPGITYYYMNHPEAFQREFTNGELATIAIASVAVAVIVVVTAIILYHILERIV